MQYAFDMDFFQIRLQHSIVGRQRPRHFILDAICGAYQCSGPPLQFYRTNRLRQVSVLYLFLLGWWCRTTLQFKFNYRKVIKMLMVPDDVSYYNFSFDMRLPVPRFMQYMYMYMQQCPFLSHYDRKVEFRHLFHNQQAREGASRQI